MQAGEFFEGKYRIVSIIGKGGMSIVYLAENINLGTYWAIKEIPFNKELGMSLPVETDILKKLEHPSLPKIFDIVEKEDNIYIIEDYINGISLDKKLKENGRFSEYMVIKWGIEICSVLSYLHGLKPNPIIYRDMKPSNIILTSNESIKLIDFGIAREYKEEAGADTVYIGTRGYAAPEQYGTGQTGKCTDIYSLGVTMHELVTGKSPIVKPFGMKSASYYNSQVSMEFEKIIKKCTSINPDDRYQTADELSRELKQLLNMESKISHNGNRAIGTHFPNNYNGFKKTIITIWDNSEFGCEFAYAAAKTTNYSVILIDLDLLSPKSDLYLGLRRNTGKVSAEGRFNESGLNIAMDFAEKGILTGEILIEASVKRIELKNLYVLTGNYRLDNYEYYNNDSLKLLIEKAYQQFDLVILLVNRFIYDSYTIMALIKSDYNIIALRADVDMFREFNNFIVFLKAKQHIPVNKTKFTAFEYNPGINLGLDVIDEITRHNFCGSVKYSGRRAKYRNLKLCYARRMEKETLNEYKKILLYFGIIPESKLLKRLRQFIFGRRLYNNAGTRDTS